MKRKKEQVLLCTFFWININIIILSVPFHTPFFWYFLESIWMCGVLHQKLTHNHQCYMANEQRNEKGTNKGMRVLGKKMTCFYSSRQMAKWKRTFDLNVLCSNCRKIGWIDRVSTVCSIYMYTDVYVCEKIWPHSKCSFMISADQIFRWILLSSSKWHADPFKHTHTNIFPFYFRVFLLLSACPWVSFV